jgi:hypothetical protein
MSEFDLSSNFTNYSDSSDKSSRKDFNSIMRLVDVLRTQTKESSEQELMDLKPRENMVPSQLSMISALVITSDYSVSSKDTFIVVESSRPCTITLPLLSEEELPGKRVNTHPLYIKSLPSSGPHKIVTSDNNTIGGRHSLMVSNHQTVCLVPIGRTWYIF